MPIKRNNPGIKDRKFVQEYVKHGHATDAAISAYGLTKRTSASAIAAKKFRRLDIQELVREEAERQGVTMEYIVSTQKKIIDRGMETLKENRVLPSDVSKSLERLTKLMGYENVGQSNPNVHNHLHLANLPRSEVLEKRKEIGSFFAEIEEK